MNHVYVTAIPKATAKGTAPSALIHIGDVATKREVLELVEVTRLQDSRARAGKRAVLVYDDAGNLKKRYDG
jgi:lysyl-tRNA synthetase class I